MAMQSDLFEPVIASSEEELFTPWTSGAFFDAFKAADKPVQDAAPMPVPLRRESSTLSTPFEPSEEIADDVISQFIHLFPGDDAATPALVFDEPTASADEPPLFALNTSISPSLAFQQYAAASAALDVSAALKSTTPVESLSLTCSPVELSASADSPPFAFEPLLPAEGPAAVPNPRKRKVSKFTGSRNTEIPLLDPEAPVAPRKYSGNSRTARKEVPVLYQRQIKKQKVDIVDENGEVLPEHKEQIEAKRLANTVAARRSRQRKAEHLKSLEDAVASLTAQLEAERAKVRALEQENARLAQK